MSSGGIDGLGGEQQSENDYRPNVWCQYNVTGWVSMWACDMLSQ